MELRRGSLAGETDSFPDTCDKCAQRNPAAAPRFVRPAEKSKSPRPEENSKESANNRPRSMHRIFRACLSAQWLTTPASLQRDQAAAHFVEFQARRRLRESVGQMPQSGQRRSKRLSVAKANASSCLHA